MTTLGRRCARVLWLTALVLFGSGAAAWAVTPPPSLADRATVETDADTETAEIVRGAIAHGRFGVQNGEATLVMTIQDARGRLIERTMRTRSLVEDGLRRTRITFTEPVDQRGVELLLIERHDGPDHQYLYLPRLGHHRRIAGPAKHGRFEGSDFSFADLERQDAGAGELRRLPEDTFAGVAVHRVEVHSVDPTPTDPAGSYGPDGPYGPLGPYGKVGLWIAKDTLVPLRVDFFDHTGKLVKDLRVRRLKPHGASFVPTLLVMSDATTKSRTTLEVVEFDPDVRLPGSLFDPAALGR